MRGVGLWAGGLVLSGALHLLAAGLYLATRDLQERPEQQNAESQFQLDTVTAPAQNAEAQTPQGEDATEATPESAAVGAGAVAQSQASALDAPSSRPEPLQTGGAAIEPVKDVGESVASAEMPTAQTQAVAAPSETVVASVAPTQSAIALERETPATVALIPDAPLNESVAPVIETALSAQPNALQVRPASAPSEIPEEPPLPTTSATAALAWQFGDRLVTDPQALTTIQAFMAPGSLANSAANAGDVKDGLTELLTSVDCARLSATFLPESGTLEMRGHIPDPSLQGQLLDALRAQVGDGIPVSANLLHLPAPQCGALTGIANVGLPQSTDQFTNERLVGATAHAREYTYAEGQRLQFDLAAPDYDAYVYVDYFSADGNVIHLVPNETIALELSAAEAFFGVGQDRGDLPSLKITIGPPFGQEIAVAFAASEPLYEGLRPIVEPAAAYLEWLQTRVAEARENDPDFKGEWVYFFITTQPNTQ